jgi:anti-sigma-K factor RskA
MNTDRERLEYLAAMVAAGAASSDEENELQGLIHQDPAAAAEMQSFNDAMAEVALHRDFAPAPESVLQGIERQIGTHTRDSGADIISLAARRKLRLWQGSTAVGIAAAAALALLLVRQRGANDDLSAKMATVNRVLQQRSTEYNDLSRQYVEQIEGQKRQLGEATKRLGVLESASVQLATLRPEESGPTVKIFMDPEEKRWLVFAFDLPEVANKDYQLWFVPEGEGAAPVPAGLMKLRGDGSFFTETIVPSDIGTVIAAAISLEPKGGSKTPTEVKVSGHL